MDEESSNQAHRHEDHRKEECRCRLPCRYNVRQRFYPFGQWPFNVLRYTEQVSWGKTCLTTHARVDKIVW